MTLCPAGTYSTWGPAPESKIPSCKVCPTGYYSFSNPSKSCKECAAGKFGSCTAPNCASEATSCTFCSAGQYQSLLSQESCTDCDAGRFASNLGNTLATCEAVSFLFFFAFLFSLTVRSLLFQLL